MKKEVVLNKLKLFFAPVVIILLGLILLINPDSATVVLFRILGGILGLVAIGFGVAALVNDQGRVGKVVVSILCALAGGWLGSNPLVLAAWFGRIIGIVLLVDGVQDILASRRQGTVFLFPAVVALVGFVLVVMPMTASRLVFSLCGLVVLILGFVMLLERLRCSKRLDGPQDPNIIDAL